jgi:hypothetical protein
MTDFDCWLLLFLLFFGADPLRGTPNKKTALMNAALAAAAANPEFRHAISC